MKKMRGPITAVVIGAILTALVTTGFAASGGGAGLTSDQALQKLMAGNKRFVESRITHRALKIGETREKLVQGQQPYAVILSCSDSRVPPEIVFDETLGKIFVVRVAGNILDPIVVGSIEYAVEHLGSPLVMVLGHEACGAVTAAFDAKEKIEGNIGAIIEAIAPAIRMVKDTAKEMKRTEQVEAAIDSNINLVAENLPKDSSVIRDLMDRGKVKVVKAKYYLHHGEVRLLK